MIIKKIKQAAIISFVFMMTAVLMLSGCANKIIGGGDTSNNVTILTTGWVNTPTNSNDPYKAYVSQKYGLNVTLKATSDFTNASLMAFSGESTPPDIISFSDMTSFRRIFDQGVLINDWTPWLDYMPNVKALVEKKDDDNPTQPSLTRRMLSDASKLNALWTIADPPTWSLKIREDWADEYRATTIAGVNYPAGNAATNGGEWQPLTPQDLLNFARWIKVAKKDCYAFTTAGNGVDFGVLGTWIPLMYGSVGVLPWGLYIDKNNEAGFAINDGNHKKMLDFVNTIVSENLIEPNWFYQTFSDKTKTKNGQIGIEWYPGSIETECALQHADKPEVDTSKWWETYDVPCETGTNGGYMPSDSFFGKIITVSAATANDTEKMKKICALINDVVMTIDETKTGKEKYQRSATYDALRWGVGIEEGLAFQNMDNTNLVYMGYYQPDNTSADKKYYRTAMPGAWDWGSWFSVNSDGVIQGNTETYTDISKKVAYHDSKTAYFERKNQLGSALNLNSTKVQDLTDYMNSFEYKYVTGQYGSKTPQQAYNDFVSEWYRKGGTQILADAKTEFIRLGLI